MYSLKVLFIAALLVVFLFGLSGGQQDNSPNRDTDVIVMAAPGAIQFAPELESAALDEAVVSSELSQVLSTFNAQRIIRCAPHFDNSNLTRISPSGQTIKILDLSRIYRIRFPSGSDLDKIVRVLRENPQVVYAERVPIYRFFSTYPNDPYFSYQWGLHNTGQSGGTADVDIDAPEAWDKERGSSSVKIGIIDTGVKHSHEDLAGKVSGETSFSEAHGTHVAGIAAAQTNNGMGVAGVSWYSPIHAEDISSFEEAEIYQDIYDAVNSGAFVLNHSWAGPYYSWIVRAAFAYAYKMNTVAVIAMGNGDGDVPQYPAAHDHGTIAVGAVMDDGSLPDWSDYGSHIDVVAPGGKNPYPDNTPEDIYSTWTAGSPPYRFLAGTSMAAPFVTGLAALLKSHDPNLDNDDVMEIIKLSSVEPPGDKYPGWDQYYGHGLVNAAGALDLISWPYSIAQRAASSGSDVGQTALYNVAFFSIPGIADGVYPSIRHTIEKEVSFGSQYAIVPNAWGRGVSTVGYSAENPNYGMGWTEVIPGTVTKTGCRLRTYVYKVYNVIGQFVGWFPCEPQDVSYKYSVHGIVDTNDPVVGVFNPNGGESFRTQNTVHITWTVDDEYPQGTTSDIFLNIYDEGGWFSVETLAEDQPVNQYGHGEFNWRVPAGTGTFNTCKIRVLTRDTNGHTGDDLSDNYFTVEYLTKPGDEPPVIREGLSGTFYKNRLYSPSPNPFNPSTSIKFELAAGTEVTLIAYDVTGAVVKTFYDQTALPAGEHVVTWDGTGDNGVVLANGVYFVNLRFSGYAKSVKAILLK